MVLPLEWYTWADEAKAWFENAGASTSVSRDFALLYGVSWASGYNPRITSVFRDPAHQQELLDRWNAGERAGFIGKPADPKKSKHTQKTFWGSPASLAMDMPSSNISGVDQIARELGLGAGSDFTNPDPGHYYER